MRMEIAFHALLCYVGNFNIRDICYLYVIVKCYYVPSDVRVKRAVLRVS